MKADETQIKYQIEQGEIQLLTIMPIGAGREVGRSCIMMNFKNKNIMFDCGIHMNRQHKGKNALPYFEKIKPEELDVILITHFHLDHCGALPYFLKNYNYRGKIFMTRPTKEIYNLVLRDSIKVKSENLDQDIMNEKSIEESLKNIEVIDYNQEIDYRGIKLKCYNAGHVLGAAMFMVEIDGVRVLYTGDYSTENERHLRPADIPNEKIHVLICESTYGDSLHEKRQTREQTLVNEIIQTLQMGGNVLLPVFATGRCHEILLILDEFWQNHPEIQHFPIYSTCTLAQKCISIFQKYINKLGERFIQGENLFNFKHVQTKKHIDDVLSNNQPKVVIASPGLLQSGHSKQLFELWCQDSRNQVLVTGQAVQDTIAWKLVNKQLPKYIVKNIEVQVNIRSQSISFSAHADYSQTATFINKLRPQHIVLVHGTAQKCADLSAKIRQDFQGVVAQVWTPENQVLVKLIFEKTNINQAGCTIIGTLADKFDQYYIGFDKEHAKHIQSSLPQLSKQKSNVQELMQDDCICCQTDIQFNGVLLHTEQGFIVCDENDTEVLQSFGIQKNVLSNSMYVPFTGTLQQVFNLIKKIHSVDQVQFNQEDQEIRIQNDILICLPVQFNQETQFLQFKWKSNPECDQLADSLAYLITGISPSELQDLEKGRQKRQNLAQLLNQSGFEVNINEMNDEIQVLFQSSEIAKGDLNGLKIVDSVDLLIKGRLENIFEQFIKLH